MWKTKILLLKVTRWEQQSTLSMHKFTYLRRKCVLLLILSTFGSRDLYPQFTLLSLGTVYENFTSLCPYVTKIVCVIAAATKCFTARP